MKKVYLFLILFLITTITSCYNKGNDDLKKALLNNINYSYTIELTNNTDNNNSSTYSYMFDNHFVNEINESDENLIYNNLKNYIICRPVNSPAYKITSTEADYNLYRKNFLVVDLSVLDANAFTYNGYNYSVNSDDVNAACVGLFDFGTNLIVNSLTLLVEDEFVVELTSEIVFENENFLANVTIYDHKLSGINVPTEVELSGFVDAIPVKTSYTVYTGYTIEEAIENIDIIVIYNDGRITYEANLFSYKLDKTYQIDMASVYSLSFDVFGINVEVSLNVVKAQHQKEEIKTYLADEADSLNCAIGLPSVGNPKVLVIPIAFTDYKAEVDMKEKLEKAFFGTSAETGWESLQSYYNKSSYGKLKIEGTVLDPYQTNYSSTYYNRKYMRGENADYEIIKAALEYYDPLINYADYDYNKDGYIDSIYFVYTAPVDYKNSESLWWAFTYEYYTDDYEYYDNVEADYYCFMGYDFFFEMPKSGKYLRLNCETVIHETGHLLGIPDYYDYDDSMGPSGGLGGGDMMDYNVGDHNPFTKILLGWVSPYICRMSMNIDLRSFASSGDCIMVIPFYEETVFTEFFLLDYYTPTGLNTLEAGYCGLFSVSGLRIYHVNAEKTTNYVYSILDIFANNNSTTEHKLLSLVQVKGSNSIANGEFATDNDLLQNGYYMLSSWYSSNKRRYDINVSKNIDGTLSVRIQ